MKGKLTIILLSIGCLLAFALRTVVAQPNDQLLYFSIHGNIAHQYIDGGLYKFTNGSTTSVDSISDNGLSIKKGFKYVRFENDKKEEVGEIRKISIVADGNMYVMFNATALHGGWTKGFYVIARTEKELESIYALPVEFVPIPVDNETLSNSLIPYIENEKNWSFKFFANNSKFNIAKIELEKNQELQLIRAEKKDEHMTGYLVAFIFPDGNVKAMPFTHFVRALTINGIPYLLLLHYGPGTGENTYSLYKVRNQDLDEIFSDSGFST